MVSKELNKPGKLMLPRHSLLLALLGLLFVKQQVLALPFNDDMVDNQMRAGSIMKPKDKDSIPVGFLANRLESAADAENMTNPKHGDKTSAENGRRLFMVNCSPCHGDISKPNWEPGRAGKLFALKKPPNIGSAEFKDRSEGKIYGTIYFGFGLMPRVGYKLSPSEKWDIVSYVKSVQAQTK